jgi:molybdopterin-containing oxidoreductase family iron-sulfur binding subunit
MVKKLRKVAETGVNAYPLFDGSNLVVSNVKIEKTGEDHEFAGMQLQNTLMGRYEIAKEVPLADFINVPFDDEKGWNKPLEYHTISGALPRKLIFGMLLMIQTVLTLTYLLT